MCCCFCFVCIWSGGGNIFIVITGILLDMQMEKDFSWFCLLRFMKEVTSALTKEIGLFHCLGCACVCFGQPSE